MKSKRLLIAGVAVASIALLAMLTYNFVHTGGLLASYVDPRGVGYAAAFGIELAVVALSVAIGTRRWHGMKTRWFEAVLIAVLLVSFMANVSQGHLQRYGGDILTTTFGSIDLVQGIIGLAATGLISLIAMAMSEIIGQYLVQLSDGQAMTVIDTPVSPSANGRKKIDVAKELLKRHPDWDDNQVVKTVPCSQSTARRARQELTDGPS